MNHLTLNMLYLILDKLIEWRDAPSKAPKVLIFEGAGDVAFCSGGDMLGLYNANYGFLPKSF